MILGQIKEGGLGSDLVFEAQQQLKGQESVRTSNFVTYLYTMKWGLQCATALA